MPDTAPAFPPKFAPRSPQAPGSLRTALVIACAALALAGCGGSDSVPAEPPGPNGLAAPENFTAGPDLSFSWSATPGATRYELFTDPDGPGPQPEAQMGDAQGFAYSGAGAQWSGGLRQARYTDLINASHRLRACDASGCGVFTAPTAFDIAGHIAHEFPSGRAPLHTASGNSTVLAALSQDGLTLALRGHDGSKDALYVFVRSSSAGAWQQQALLASGASRIVLSADGGTLAASSALGNAPLQVYQRAGGVWGPPTTIDAVPAACPPPCALAANNTALSADGSVLAATGRSNAASAANAVFIYARSGAAWSPQAYFAPGGEAVGTVLALSGDGRTLAVNGGAFTRSGAATPPQLHVLAQGGGAWSEQARLPAGIVNFQDIAASRNSKAALSSDGNVLAIQAQNLPGLLPASLDIGAGDLTCGSLEPWNTAPMGSYSAEAGWHLALFARDGGAWRRAAVMARGDLPWALASAGDALFYGGGQFTRSSGAWACP